MPDVIPPKSLRSQLHDLEVTAETVKTAWKEAEADARAAAVRGSDVADELAEYQRDVEFKRRVPDDVYEAELVEALATDIIARRLQVEFLDPHRPHAGLRFIETEPRRHADDMRDRSRAALQEWVDFQRKHGAAMKEEEAATHMRRVRTALDGDDPAALAEAIHALPASSRTPTALRSDDLPPRVMGPGE